MKISVVINTYNAEQYLERVLESVKGFDEVVICDMHSTDATLKIASRYGCKVTFHDKVPFVEPARNFAIAQASHDWVLVVDADEIIPAPLVTYLYDHISMEPNPKPLQLARKNYFMGKLMRSAYPDFNLRFIKKGTTFWPPYIHSHPQIEGKFQVIPAKRKDLAMEHLVDEEIENLLNKYNVYTTAEVSRRSNQKISGFRVFFSPFFCFLKFYLFKLGFLDGIAGLFFALFKAQYKFNTLAKIALNQKKLQNINF